MEAQVGTLESELKKSERRLRREVRRREHAESELRRSEARFQSLAAFGDHHLFVMDAEGRYLFSNREQGLSVGGERLSFIGRNQKEFHPREVAGLYEDRMRAVLETGRAVEFEHFAPEPDGLHHHQDTLYPIEENGRIVALGGICRDVTAQKDVQHRLDLSEERYRRIVETANEGVWAMDGDYVTIYVNRRMADMLGYRPEEMIGRRVDFFMFPEDLPDHATKMAARQQGENAVYERRFRCKDGREVWTIVSATALTDAGGQFAGSFAMFTDITKRKTAEDVLLVYETMVSSSQDAMSLVGLDYIYRTVNDTYQRRTGWPRDRIVGKHVAEIVGREVFEKIVRPYMDRSFAGEVATYAEWFDFPAQGRRYVEVTYSPCRDRQSRIIGSLVNARDVTARKNAEEALTKSAVLLNATQRLAKIGGWEWDTVKHAMSWTEETYRIHDLEPHGLDSGPEDLIELSLACYDPPDRPRIIDAFRRCTERGEGYDLEFPFTSAAGRRLWVRTSAQPEYEGGRVVRVVGNIMDITRRKRSEEILQARLRLSEAAGSLTLEDLLQQALDEAERITGSRIGFIHFVEADERSLSLQMWSTNTLRGMCTAEGRGRHYSVDLAGVWVDCIRQRQPVIHNDYASLPNRKGMPRGHAPVVRELVVPILRNDRIVAVIGVGNKPQEYDTQDVEAVSALANLAWDVVLRKRAEEQMELQGLVLDQAQDHVTIANLDGVIRYVNQAECRALRRSRSELIGRHVDVLGEDPERGATQREIIESTLSKGEWRGEVINHSAEGSKSIIDLRTFMVRSSAGKAIAMCGIGTDITQRKLAEAELRQSQVKLRDLYRQLQNAREEERRRISRELHDELGQNITALKIDLAWLAHRVDPGRPALLQKLDSMNGLAEAMLDTVRRVSAELRPGVLDSLGLAAAAEWLVRDFEKRAEVACRIRVTPDEIAVAPGLATDVFRILQETLTNVARHARASRVEVTLVQKADMLELNVIDNGIGIPADRVSSSDSFGLLGIRERLLPYRAALRVEGLPGGGTAVRVAIPIEAKAD